MDRFILENADRYQSLVQRFEPRPPSEPKAEVAPAADMLVTARIRPLLPDEAGLPLALRPRGPSQPGVLDVHELRQRPRGLPTIKSYDYEVDRIFKTDCTTEDIYHDVVKPLVPWAYDGGIGTLFAYGQTGSGKTHTVSQLERLIAAELFSGTLGGSRDIYMTIVELFGNTALDLLNDRASVSVLQDSFGTTQLHGAAEHHITSAAAMLALVETAASFRRTEATDKSSASSRSHAVCRIRLVNAARPSAEDGVLYLIDLAGSEAARDTAAHGPARIRETREINTSLSTLKDCIRGKAAANAAEASGQRKPHVPWRQSSLTKILKHVLDPAAYRPCKTVVVACVNPSLADVHPSRNTLRYAETLRVLLPRRPPVVDDPKAPVTWTNEMLTEWIRENSGSPPIDPAILAPTESGTQLLHLPIPDFEARCLDTPGVSLEQARAFRAKLWLMHIDSEAAQNGDDNSGDDNGKPNSREPDAAVRALPWTQRIRSGMFVAWDPPSGHALERPDKNFAVVLAPVRVGSDTNSQDEGSWLCADVMINSASKGYEVQMWQHVSIDVAQLSAEVIFEYDASSRLYYLVV
ncbi:P-loop containing nucleoside triphosphate hydrolase protein [Dactylonectria estremocensis]|uniref:Kinesin-like protein n=1 Tax=Dactylonectria estremocensis TaxID=1079267 RepID=A0A9P9EGK5_9HYPO|nr:P-loop containing nucleoside triphosphate hydrolase protein [Dactylonectria estremocensis]